MPARLEASMQIIHAKQALTPTGWMADVEICINEAGRIDAVQRQEHRCDQSVDLALPAPANLHSHTFQRAMAGLTESRGPLGHDSFWSWRKIMYQFLDQLTPDDVQSIAALAFMEMMEAGDKLFSMHTTRGLSLASGHPFETRAIALFIFEGTKMKQGYLNSATLGDPSDADFASRS